MQRNFLSSQNTERKIKRKMQINLESVLRQPRIYLSMNIWWWSGYTVPIYTTHRNINTQARTFGHRQKPQVIEVKSLPNYTTLGKSFDFPLPFGPPPSWALHRNSLKTRCYIKANISWRPALLTSLKSTKFRRSVQITPLRLNSFISGPDDNQRQTDGRLMNVIGRKASLNIAVV